MSSNSNNNNNNSSPTKSLSPLDKFKRQTQSKTDQMQKKIDNLEQLIKDISSTDPQNRSIAPSSDALDTLATTLTASAVNLKTWFNGSSDTLLRFVNEADAFLQTNHISNDFIAFSKIHAKLGSQIQSQYADHIEKSLHDNAIIALTHELDSNPDSMDQHLKYFADHHKTKCDPIWFQTYVSNHQKPYHAWSKLKPWLFTTWGLTVHRHTFQQKLDKLFLREKEDPVHVFNKIMLLINKMNKAIHFSNTYKKDTNLADIPIFSDYDIIQVLGRVFIRNNTSKTPLNSLVRKKCLSKNPQTMTQWKDMKNTWKSMISSAESGMTKNHYTPYRESIVTLDIFNTDSGCKKTTDSNSKHSYALNTKFKKSKKGNQHLKKRKRNWLGFESQQPPKKRQKYDFNNRHDQNFKSNINCHRCGKKGHFKRDCFSRKHLNGSLLGRPNHRQHRNNDNPNRDNNYQRNRNYNQPQQQSFPNVVYKPDKYHKKTYSMDSDPNNVPFEEMINQPPKNPDAPTAQQVENELYAFVAKSKQPELINMYNQRKTLNANFEKMMKKYHPRH